jgi:hypothetical protein
MPRTRLIAFENLESRRLMASAHMVAAAHHSIASPLPLDSLLVVDQSAGSTTPNADGSYTTSTPVSGIIPGLGKVHGDWNESVDPYGNYLGPDSLQLSAPGGSVTLEFSAGNLGKIHKYPAPIGDAFAPLAQQLAGGSGAYRHVSERGTIQLITNANKDVVARMAIVSKP